MSKNNKKTIVNIIEGIIIALLIALIGGMLFLYFSFKDRGASPQVFGYTIYHTHASNMEPNIPAGTVIFAKESEKENIKAGSVVLCRIGENTVLTRVVQLVNENGVMSYVVRFDTDEKTYKLPGESIIARAVRQDAHLGGLLDFATSTEGIMLVIIIPSFIVIVFQVIRIVNAKKAEEAAYSLDDLDELIKSQQEDGGFFFEEPDIPERKEPEEAIETMDTQPAVVRTIREDPDLSVEFKNETPKQVLSINKNGKAELKLGEADSSGIYTYDKMELVGSAKPAKQETKPEEDMYPDSPYDESVTGSAEAAARFEEPQTAARENERSGAPQFMSTILPEKLAGAVSNAETPDLSKKPATPVQVVKKPDERTAQAAARSIPAKAVVPKEKLAPPPKKNNGRTIMELMSIIDAEESKLK